MQTTTAHPPEKSDIDVGYLRLTDSAPFLIAKDLGFFIKFGLNVTLRQETSWANVRDKLVTGGLDAAQMLAPLPAMTTLGVSGLREPMLTGLVLSNHGNAITLSQTIWQKTRDSIESGEFSTLLGFLKAHSQLGPHKLTFATVHAFSSHTLLLRRWLRSGGIDPDRDIKILVVPPSQMVDSLQTGVIDGYCVGEPWNTIAVKLGVGSIVALGSEIWPRAPEKVLGVSEKWHNLYPNTHLRLRMALLKACEWLADPTNTTLAARILALPGYLNMPIEYLVPSLTGVFMDHHNDIRTSVPDYHLFHGENLNRPDQQVTAKMIRECADLLGRPIDSAMVQSLTKQSCRPDLFAQTINALETTKAIPAS